MDQNTVIPKASLWIGNSKNVELAIINYLQKLYCSQACKTCFLCQSIQEKQFHAMYWMASTRSGRFFNH
jgi:hypothetical protein